MEMLIMKLRDSVAIVTGGGKGIGKAIALAFAAEGAKIVVAARSLDNLEDTVKEIKGKNGRAIAIQADVSDEKQVQRMVQNAIAEYGQIDILVNNSGISGPTVPVVDLRIEDWNEVIAIDLTGTMLCTREVLKYMIPRKSGNIINISSISGREGYTNRSPYCVCKWGIIGFTQTVAKETGQYNIRVNCIAPGGVTGERVINILKGRAEATGVPFDEVMSQEMTKYSLGRMTEEAEVASTAVFLASADASAITGQTINVNCGSGI
jgi:NAD(P)-dependent dehydrogenase (short-subunit alcohol dehydrogenase family)